MDRIVFSSKHRDLPPANVERWDNHLPESARYALGDLLPENFEMACDYSPQYDHFSYRIWTHLYGSGSLPGVAVKAWEDQPDRIIQILMMEHKCIIKDLAEFLRQEANRLEGSLQV